MTSRIDLYCCGDEVGSSSGLVNQRDVEIHRRSEPLSQWTSVDFSESLSSSNADWILFVDQQTGCSSEELERLTSAGESQPEATVVVLPTRRMGDLQRCWERLPLPLAALLAPPAERVIVGIRGSAADVSFRDVDRPLWDLLIRLSSEPHRIAVASGVESSSNGADYSAISLPSLQPHRPSGPRSWLYEHLSRFDVSSIMTETGHREEIVALKAGLLQLHDYLDESHDLSQTVQGEGRNRAGDYWHAIMHRREPDYSNAKYWFRRVGRHPIFDPLADRAAVLLTHCASPAASEWKQRMQAANDWEPFEFVDLCEACANSEDEALTRAAESIQFAEMLLLIEHTFLDAEA